MAAKKPPITRVRIAREELEKMTNEDFLKCWTLQEQYVDHLENKLNSNTDYTELMSLRESEEKLKQQQIEATRRENILVMRLSTKEQEMQEYVGQIQELKQAQVPSIAQLRSALLDPAVNLLFERMRKEMDSLKARLEETQNELSAWKFTPDSNTGKRLMAKCRLLYQENEELGKIISSGRMAKLEGDLALQRSFSEEMKKCQTELDEFMLELDEDVEGMQITILQLQQQLREAKDQILLLQKEKQKLTGLPNGSPNHSFLMPDDSGDTNQSQKQNTRERDSLDSNSISNDLNGNGKSVSMRSKDIKKEILWPEEKTGDNFVLETAKNSVCNETLIHSPKREILKDSSRHSTPDSNVQSVIVENSLAIHDRQTPLAEKTNTLVDGLETTSDTVSRTTDQHLVKTECEEGAHNSSTSKRTHESGRGRKRMRPRTPVESDEKKEENLPVRKRTRRREAQASEDKRTSLDIDTDTEVQVAETLAYWASAKQERTEVQPDPSSSLGNGEIVNKESNEK